MTDHKTTIVPVSGGKDSQVTLSLALEAGLNPVCVHQDTGWDHSLTYKQIRRMEEVYGVTIHHTVSRYGGMIGFLGHAQYFPNSAARGCTQRLKQEPFARWILENGYNEENAELWFGMRAAESSTRGSKYGHLRNDDVFTLGDISSFYSKGWAKPAGRIPCRLPIVEWTDEEVFSRLREEGAPINELYERGHHRVGCYPCLLARKSEWELAGRDEEGAENIKKLIALEEQWHQNGNPRKFITVHRSWDVRKFLEGNTEDMPDQPDGCGYCSI